MKYPKYIECDPFESGSGSKWFGKVTSHSRDSAYPLCVQFSHSKFYYYIAWPHEKVKEISKREYEVAAIINS